MKGSSAADSSFVSDFISGARNNSFGRRVNVELGEGLSATFKAAGMRAAFDKLALDAGALTELAGLGLIAAPVAHSLVSGGKQDENPTVKKIHQTSDLAGLGLLASPYIMKLLKRG